MGSKAHLDAMRSCLVGLKANSARKEALMDDMPMWMKLLIWIVVGGTVLYTITSVIISAMA
jgi:hypothetical protein